MSQTQNLKGATLSILSKLIIDSECNGNFSNVAVNTLTAKNINLKDQNTPQNIYVIGQSNYDTDNFANYYPNIVANEFTLIPGQTDLREFTAAGATTILGPLDRVSEGLTSLDYIAQLLQCSEI